MKAMILAFETPGDFAKRDLTGAAFKAYMDEWYAYGGSLEKAGVLRGGAALAAPHASTVVSMKNGRRVVEDGPYSDSKEQLGGYFIIEVASLDEAAEWAKGCPSAKSARVDVRAIPDYGRGE